LNGAPYKQQQFDPAYLHQNNKPQGHTPCGLLHHKSTRIGYPSFKQGLAVWTSKKSAGGFCCKKKTTSSAGGSKKL
jgi:hypothetical protein